MVKKLLVLLCSAMLFSTSVTAVPKSEVNKTALEDVTVRTGSASGKWWTNLTWTLDDKGTLTISGKGDMSPEYNREYYPWYEYSNDIVNVVIESGVTSISTYAFSGYPNIKSVTIPNTVTEISGAAFHNNYGLEEITIPEGVTKIGSGAFSNCNNLKHIEIPDSVTVDMLSGQFKGCTKMESVKIGKGIRTIGREVFSGCKNLKSIVIPSNVKTIGENAFYNCDGLLSVVIENGTKK